MDPITYRRFLTSEDVYFYNAPKEIPSVCGGRVKSRVYDLLLTNQQIQEFSETLGPRFSLLATNTWAEYSVELCKICEVLQQNGSSLVIARKELAWVLKQFHPDLKLNASCIMSLYEPWDQIISDPTYHRVCAPQWWNYDVEDMVSNVPAEQRGRVYYVINSMCRWGPHCKGHYENSSLSYIQDRAPKWGAPHETPFPAKDGVDMAIRSHILGVKLLNAGFMGLKLQGRGDRSRDLIPIVLSLQGRIQLPNTYQEFVDGALYQKKGDERIRQEVKEKVACRG